MVVEEEGRYVVQATLGGVGILDAAHGDAARKRVQDTLVEHFAEQAESTVAAAFSVFVKGGDTGRFLPPVLQGVKSVIDKVGGVWSAIYTENAHILIL